MKKFLNWLKSPSSDFALFIILLILANIVGVNSYRRIDLTRTRAYSLSNASKQIVKNLEEPLSIRVFFDKNLPSIYQSTAQYVEDLMVEYKNAANKNFSVSYMDMSKVENQNIARDFGLRQIQIQELKNNEVGLKQVYMGLVITYGDAVEKIDAITSAKGFEYKVTSAISKMINTADTLSSLKDDEKINVTLYLSNELKSLGISGAEEAEQYIHDDMFDYSLNSVDCKVDPVKLNVYQNENNGCEWNLEKIHITSKCITSKEEIKKSEQVLIDNGIEKDEAQVVLQAIGYTLLGIELYPEEKKDD